MANTKSIQKVMKYLKECSTPVTASKISLEVMLPQKTVWDVIKILEDFERVNKMSNGKTTLIQLNENKLSNGGLSQ